MAGRYPSVSEINKMKRDDMKELLIEMKKKQNPADSQSGTPPTDGDSDIREMLSEILVVVRSLQEDKEIIRNGISDLKKENQRITGILAKQQTFLDRLDHERRSRNLVISGLPEEADAATDRGKVEEILAELDGTPLPPTISCARLGKPGTRPRVIKVTLDTPERRERIVGKSAALKDVPTLKHVYVKRDTHPAVREEWSRLHKAFKEEKTRPENEGCNIVFNKKEKSITRDGVVIDQWNKPVFS